MLLIALTCGVVLADEPQYSFLRINTSHGLVNNQVTSVFKDSRGFVWIGTSSGLSRFDGSGFKNFRYDRNDSSTIIENDISDIEEVESGDILIRTTGRYTLYDIKKEVFLKQEAFLEKYGIGDTVEDIYVDKNKKSWFKLASQSHYITPNGENGFSNPFRANSEVQSAVSSFYHDGINYYYLYGDGTIESFDGQNYQLIYRDRHLNGKLGVENLNYEIFVDNSSDIWVYAGVDGCYYFQAASKQWHHFTTNSEDIKLSSNLISKIIQDKEGVIWLGTDHGGIDLYNKSSHSLTKLYHEPEDPKSLSQNSITDLFLDDFGIVWIGTYKSGFCYYHESIYKFPLYNHLSSDNTSLPFEDVNCFAEDKEGNLWIGTNGGGLLYFDREKGTYKVYKNDPDNANSLSNNVIVNIYLDAEGLLWIGTYTGGLNTFDGKNFKRYSFSKEIKNSLPNDNIWTINQDNQGRMWIGTLGSGIVLYDKASDSFMLPPNKAKRQLPSSVVTAIHKMRNGNMFIATSVGVIFYDMNRQQYINHPFYDNKEPLRISNNLVNDVFEDSRGLLWIATRSGLNLIDPNTDQVTMFEEVNGLSTDIINCIEEDDEKAIWISKSSGLSQINVVEKQIEGGYEFSFRHYSEADGLQGKEFNVNAKYKTSKGELIFGGANGFNLFQPENIIYNSVLPKVEFTDFQLFNSSVKVGEKVLYKTILDKSIVLTGRIELKQSMNVFSIEFAALNFFIPNKGKYKYILEGFDQQWVMLGGDVRKVTYTNLNAGEYTFKVKASNNDGLWNENYSQLQLVILPPFYQTSFAYATYILIIVGFLLYYRHMMIKRTKLKFHYEQERLMTKRHLEMDEMKLRFLTNVSHEFRTPLTLILAPLDKLMKLKNGEQEHHLLETINRNAHQLLGLVNQLLDFRKLDLQGLQYKPSYGDLISFLRDVCENFEDSFQKKEVLLEFESSLGSLNFEFDHEKLQKIMMNLISNALKFTPAKGSVLVSVEKTLSNSEEEFVCIKVEDTGVGILDEEKEKIFERFYQSERNNAMGISGSGIGLNLVREMVQLHQGTIEVKSEINKGATFVVSLPLSAVEGVRREVEAEVKAQEVVLEEEGVREPSESTTQIAQNNQSILLVEDNSDFRSFMRESLADHYKIFEAPDGKEGLKIAYSKLPDVIISDVMMPQVGGLELCSKLKGDLRTSHIPIILLTARTADEDKIKGLEIGADDYITKPFNLDLLLLRVQKLMEKQKSSQERFQKKMEVNPSEIEISSIDEKLIKKALALVEKNIADPKFSVGNLSHELGMSRVHLYKKLLAITGKTPIEFIRIIRLKRGAVLLEKSQMTISEVAYKVGFNTPRYFSKYFEEEFGVLPSEYLKKH
ncbi:two-component regulator propeller domain-containing protein [Flammeovirgaceae bacterium SG7u.111]|nr:two-component regulator propeller domain-containing protein [Flammeovirgaceae bacterium SG7u.132]WPO34809.1 two-component regulator propeller domain-containing protein [Flammeovirgaceae bacterium SG7u.111]